MLKLRFHDLSPRHPEDRPPDLELEQWRRSAPTQYLLQRLERKALFLALRQQCVTASEESRASMASEVRALEAVMKLVEQIDTLPPETL